MRFLFNSLDSLRAVKQRITYSIIQLYIAYHADAHEQPANDQYHSSKITKWNSAGYSTTPVDEPRSLII